MFSVIRRSHIEQYVGCPYSLYLQLILGITPPMGKHAQLGVIVHELIEEIQRNNITQTQALAELERYIQEWNLNTDDDYSIITVELEDLGKLCLSNFYAFKNKLCNDFKLELNFRYELEKGLPLISCTLDRVEFVGEEIHIRDWKTGQPMSGKKLIEDLQPPLYIYGVYNEFNKWPTTFNLHYLQKDKVITYKHKGSGIYEIKTKRNTYELDVNKAIERTKGILKDIKDNKFNIPNKETHIWRCNNLCWFGISGKCTGVQTEQWKKLNELYTKNREKLMESEVSA